MESARFSFFAAAASFADAATVRRPMLLPYVVVADIRETLNGEQGKGRVQSRVRAPKE